MGGVMFDLKDVTTNVDVYFTFMRYNRAANEWDVDVTLSNKVTQAQAGPMVLVVDNFTGTSGPLRPDGSSSNQFFYDFSGQLPAGNLPAKQQCASRTIALGFTPGVAPELTTSVFAAAAATSTKALAFTRSLDQTGQPLPGVIVQESGPDGTSSNQTDSVFGVITLGNSPGNYTWQFSLTGCLPVWRQAALQSNSVAVLPYPRLTARNAQPVSLSPLTGGTISNQSVQLQFGGGAFSQNTSAYLTMLDGQSLPSFLPQGWSPLQAFWLELNSNAAQGPTATILPGGNLAASENAALVTFDTNLLTWRVLQLAHGNGSNALNVSLPGSGAYTLVAADTGLIAPPSPVVGSSLPPSQVSPANASNLVATAIVTPGSSPASSLARDVTALAQVSVTNPAGPLPSGTLLRDEVSQFYLLEDGSTRVPPLFDNFIAGYHRPANTVSGALQAQFPVRPLLLFGPRQLNQGTVHVDVFAPDAFSGAVIDTNGGSIAADPVRLLAAAGVVARQQAIELRAVSPTNFNGFPGTNYPVAAAFEVAAAGILPGRQLLLQVNGLPTNTTFVLGQVIDQSTLYGIAPVARLHSDANGHLFSDAPPNADLLSGLPGSGQYVLIEVAPEQGLVEGVAHNSTGQVAGGLGVSVAGQPWMALSAPDGSFKLLAPVGPVRLAVTDLSTGDTGSQAVTIPTNLASVVTSVSSSVIPLTGASTSPGDKATNVPVVTSVVIDFSRPLNPSTFTSNSVQLIEGTNPPIVASLTLDLSNITATLLPSAPLDAGAQFQVALSSNITDDIGRPLSGQTVFTFTTTPPSVRSPAAILTIYQPGATNLPTNLLGGLPGYVSGSNSAEIVVQGSPGTSDQGVPVIIANEGTGETTTVTSQPDGSFVSFVHGQEQDFISATFIGLNGARFYVPVNRHVFDDGSVGLYTQGGSLTATGTGPTAQITVPPNAIQSRTVFKLNSVNTNDLQEQLGVMPTTGSVVSGGLKLSIKGTPPTLPVQVSFPVDLSTVGYPTNEAPTNVAAVLAAVQTNQNVPTYQVMSQMTFAPQSGGGQAPAKYQGPLLGGKPRGGPSPIVGVLEGALQFSGIEGFAADVILNYEVIPLVYGARPENIEGQVRYVPLADVYATAHSQNQPGLVTSVGIGVISHFVPVFGPAIFGAAAISDAILSAAEYAASLPLEGAFVTVNQVGAPDPIIAGQISPGMVYATSGSDGSFLTVVPQAGADYLVTVSHPNYYYPLTVPVNPSGTEIVAGEVYKNFYFSVPLPVLTQPTVSISVVPIQPAPGETCTVQVTAYQATAAPSITVTDTVGNKDLQTGQPVTPNVTLFGTPATQGTTTTWTGTLLCDSRVEVTLHVSVPGHLTYLNVNRDYPVDFTGVIPVTPSTIPAPMADDTHGPQVVQVDPPDNGFIGGDDQITITFDKPIDAFVSNHLAGIQLVGPGQPFTPILNLSGDQQQLQIRFPGAQPGSTYSLTLTGTSIRDLAAQPLNQAPNSQTPVNFTTTFRTPTQAIGKLPSVENGRGSVILGTNLYVLDQGSVGNYLDVYDISAPTQPVLDFQLPLPGAPRDLAAIPQYRYVTSIHNNAPILTNDIIAVVGGDLDGQINQAQGTTFTQSGQYLYVFAMGGQNGPQLLASPTLSLRVGSVVPKVVWAPPFLVYQEFGTDIQQLGFANLQAMIIGFGASVGAQESFPEVGTPGSSPTATIDGSYVDPGDTLPQPGRSQFFGWQLSYVLEGTTQPILDFSVTPGGTRVGITLRNGVELNNLNQPTTTNLPPMYRTLATAGPLNISSPTDAAFNFGSGAYPRWVQIFDNLLININGVPTNRAIALVSLQPDADGVDKLAVIDISSPENPALLNKISIPSTLTGGDVQSISQRADGFIEVAGTQNLLVLDPSQLANNNIPAGQLSPAIVGVLVGAGGIQRALGSSIYGIHAVADSGHNVIIQSAPQLSFVNFPQSSSLVDPQALASLTDSGVQAVLANEKLVGGLSPARVQANFSMPGDLAPNPNTALHYYVLLQAPGTAGSSIDLGLESLNEAGWPLANRGAGFAPVRAVSLTTQTAIGQLPRPGCGAPIRSLPAYRLSNNPDSPYYNEYLSRPFVLITEAITTDNLSIAQNNGGVGREILFGGALLRAFIEPDAGGNPTIGPFAAQIDSDRQLIYPIAVVSAPTVNKSYVPGDNPPPPGGATAMPGTFGSICAHSGELRTEATDMVLPSRHIPIEIKRAIGNQDNYEGPLGAGWDFNYNQRLTVLDPLIFPSGLVMPVVTRDLPTDSEIAGSKDVLFHSGMGQTVIFQWISSTMPPEYAKDPLVAQLNYSTYVSDYYLPAAGQGVFDLLVKFFDGRFERVTPLGERYRYTAQGRLEVVFDRFQRNNQVLSYDSHGWLTNINDFAVLGPRYVGIGHYRMQNAAGQQTDKDFMPSLDMPTTDAALNGKICRLADYAGRDVLYSYSADGFLTNVLGIQVAGENGGYTGRSHTFYAYSACRLVQVAATVSDTPILNVDNAMTSSGKPVAQSTSGIGNNVALTMPLNITAANLAQQPTAAGLADGTSYQYNFDKYGNVTSKTITGSDGTAAATTMVHDSEGRLTFIQYPEGNFKTMSYDTNNPVFRSRDNLLAVTNNPGPRGGTIYVETYQYDPRCNLKSGNQIDGDGFTTAYNLSPDGTFVQSIAHGNGSSAATETFGYNSNGQLTTETDVRGVTSTIAYDSTTGFRTSFVLGDSSHTYTYNYGSDLASQLGCPASVTMPVGQALQKAYNANLQLVQAQRGKLVQNMGYDELGHLQYQQVVFGDGTVLAAQHTYDPKGFLYTNVINGLEVNGQVTTLEYDYTPDPLFRVASVKYPQRVSQQFLYDSRGNLIQKQLGDYIEQYTHDLNNNLTSIIQGGDVVKTNTYDGFDRLITSIRKTGTVDETEAYTYYSEGEPNSVVVTDPQQGVIGQRANDQIDALGRTLHQTITGTTIAPTYQFTYAPGSETTQGPRMTSTRTWDAGGFDIGLTDPNLTSITVRDGYGNITQVTQQEDGATYHKSFQYDDLNNRTSTSDDLSQLFAYLPRADGAILASTNAIGHFTTYTQSALGELLDEHRQDGMEFQHQHDPQRRPSYNGDPTAGSHYAYDGEFRLTNSTLRNGVSKSFFNFNHQNMPQSVNLPGAGTITLAYDLQKRLTSETVNYLSTTYQVSKTYDALDRPARVGYQQDNGANNLQTFDFDEAGPLLWQRFQEDAGDFKVNYSYYADGTRKTIAYPSGVTVTETRDTTGRLTGVSDGNGTIIEADSWQGNEQPKVVHLGTTMVTTNTYDARGRLTGRRTSRLSDGAVLVHLRYQYDAANNQQIRQFIHRNGKADNLFYDTGERLSEAQLGAVPLGPASFTPPLIDRSYSYHTGGLDYLTSAAQTNLASSVPPFATNWTSHDNFLLPTIVDGFNRGAADPMGNVAQALLQVRPVGAAGTTPVSATLVHNGNGSLVSIQRADGLLEQNFFQPNGLRYERKITQNGQVLSFRHYVYDTQKRLLEEYEQTNSVLLVGRYYYGAGDAPDAADLLDPSSGPLQRYYYLKDNMESVVAVADANGNIVERAWYDAFGQPAIELRDTKAPVIQSVSEGADINSLLIAFSESVYVTTNDPGVGGGPVFWPSVSANVISVLIGSTVVPGTVQLLPSLPGFPPYSVLRFTPNQSLPQGPLLTVTLNAGMLADDWGNTNALDSVFFHATNQAGAIYYQPQPAPQTAAVPVARSSIGSPFLFQGQYFDYDAGLVYLRTRFYDPYSGMFLEPDPTGYADSVNLYAAMGNNPVGFRDPSGLADELPPWLVNAGAEAEEAAEAARSSGQFARSTENLRVDMNRAPKPTLNDTPAARLTGGPALSARVRTTALGEVDRAYLQSMAAKWGAEARQMAGEAAKADAPLLAEQAMKGGENWAKKEASWRSFIDALNVDAIRATVSKAGQQYEAWARGRLARRIIAVGPEDETLAYSSVRFEPKENVFDVVIHGSYWKVYFNGSWLGPEELAELIWSHPGYRAGMKIRLLSCSTGEQSNGFAQRMANLMKVEVEAPEWRLSLTGEDGAGGRRWGFFQQAEATSEYEERPLRTFSPQWPW